MEMKRWPGNFSFNSRLVVIIRKTKGNLYLIPALRQQTSVRSHPVGGGEHLTQESTQAPSGSLGRYHLRSWESEQRRERVVSQWAELDAIKD